MVERWPQEVRSAFALWEKILKNSSLRSRGNLAANVNHINVVNTLPCASKQTRKGVCIANPAADANGALNLDQCLGNWCKLLPSQHKTLFLYIIYTMLASVEDVGPSLYKCNTNVFCLLVRPSARALGWACATFYTDGFHTKQKTRWLGSAPGEIQPNVGDAGLNSPGVGQRLVFLKG